MPTCAHILSRSICEFFVTHWGLHAFGTKVLNIQNSFSDLISFYQKKSSEVAQAKSIIFFVDLLNIIILNDRRGSGKACRCQYKAFTCFWALTQAFFVVFEVKYGGRCEGVERWLGGGWGLVVYLTIVTHLSCRWNLTWRHAARHIKSQRDVFSVGLRPQTDVSGDRVWRQIVGLLRVLVHIASV